MTGAPVALTLAQHLIRDALARGRYDLLLRCVSTYPVKGKVWSSWPGDTMTGDIFFPLGRSDMMFVVGATWRKYQLTMYSRKGNTVTRDWVLPLKFDQQLSNNSAGYLGFKNDGTLAVVFAKEGQLLPRQLTVAQKKVLGYGGLYAEYSFGFEGLLIGLTGVYGPVENGSIPYETAEDGKYLPTLPEESRMMKSPHLKEH